MSEEIRLLNQIDDIVASAGIKGLELTFYGTVNGVRKLADNVIKKDATIARLRAVIEAEVAWHEGMTGPDDIHGYHRIEHRERARVLREALKS